MYKLGSKYRVYLQEQDGTTIEIPGILQSMTVNASHVGNFEVDISFVGTGEIVTSAIGNIKENKSSTEWSCDFCGRVNQRKDETCKSCGAVRSFTM